MFFLQYQNSFIVAVITAIKCENGQRFMGFFSLYFKKNLLLFLNDFGKKDLLFIYLVSLVE